MRLFAKAYICRRLFDFVCCICTNVKVGSSTLSVSPPAGFCEVDKAEKADTSWLTSVTNLLNIAGITLVAAFPDCRELKKLEQSNQFIITKVYISALTNEIGKSSSRTVSETCDELKTKTYSDEQKADLAKSAQGIRLTEISVADSKALGVLEDIEGEVFLLMSPRCRKLKLRAGDLRDHAGPVRRHQRARQFAVFVPVHALCQLNVDPDGARQSENPLFGFRGGEQEIRRIWTCFFRRRVRIYQPGERCRARSTATLLQHVVPAKAGIYTLCFCV